MKIVEHPYLAGVLCRSDGAVWLPVTRGSATGPHWTFGSANRDGYRQVAFVRKHYLAHRLIAEAFLGLCPAGCEIDHINRIKSDNRPENLRWATRSQNQRNRAVCIKGMENAVSQYADRKAYGKAYYEAQREARKAYNAGRRAKMKVQGLTKRKGPDGKWGWYPFKRA